MTPPNPKTDLERIRHRLPLWLTYACPIGKEWGHMWSIRDFAPGKSSYYKCEACGQEALREPHQITNLLDPEGK